MGSSGPNPCGQGSSTGTGAGILQKAAAGKILADGHAGGSSFFGGGTNQRACMEYYDDSAEEGQSSGPNL